MYGLITQTNSLSLSLIPPRLIPNKIYSVQLYFQVAAVQLLKADKPICTKSKFDLSCQKQIPHFPPELHSQQGGRDSETASRLSWDTEPFTEVQSWYVWEIKDHVKEKGVRLVKCCSCVIMWCALTLYNSQLQMYFKWLSSSLQLTSVPTTWHRRKKKIQSCHRPLVLVAQTCLDKSKSLLDRASMFPWSQWCLTLRKQSRHASSET